MGRRAKTHKVAGNVNVTSSPGPPRPGWTNQRSYVPPLCLSLGRLESLQERMPYSEVDCLSEPSLTLIPHLRQTVLSFAFLLQHHGGEIESLGGEGKRKSKLVSPCLPDEGRGEGSLGKQSGVGGEAVG